MQLFINEEATVKGIIFQSEHISQARVATCVKIHLFRHTSKKNFYDFLTLMT